MDQEQNTAPQSTGESGFPPAVGGEKKDGNPMMLVGVVVLIIVVLAFGWYMMGMNNQEVTPTPSVGAPTTDAQQAADAAIDATAASLATQSSSDDLGAIEADANATDLKTLDSIDNIQ